MTTMRRAATCFITLAWISALFSCRDQGKIDLTYVIQMEKRNTMTFLHLAEVELNRGDVLIINPPNGCSSCVAAIESELLRDNVKAILMLPSNEHVGDAVENEARIIYYNVSHFKSSGLTSNYPLRVRMDGDVRVEPLIGD